MTAAQKNSKRCRTSIKQKNAFIDHFKQIVISGIGKLIKFVCNLHGDQNSEIKHERLDRPSHNSRNKKDLLIIELIKKKEKLIDPG